ncbi:asparagine synthase [Leucobacter sp. CX42]|uniref:asparagine synthase n=1 Tax=unclassified Leucobacter TaxID=2621730 RepID=UPI00334270A3
MFGIFSKRQNGKRGGSAKKPPRRLPRRVLAPVEEIVEQGLLVADVAVRMEVKNSIIMNALKRHEDYDKERIRTLVHDAAIELAEEREKDARHIARMRDEIRDTGRSAWIESEYGNEDNRTLRHRQEVYERVAEELRKRAADENYLNDTSERARALAWDEVGDSLKERASHPYYAGGGSAEYQEHRDERIQQLIDKDLTELLHDHAPKPEKVRRGFRRGAKDDA